MGKSAASADLLTYTNVSRFFYVQCGAWCLQCALAPDMLAQTLGIEAKTFETQSGGIILGLCAAVMWCVTMGWIATSQMSEFAQRKVLQYTLIAPVLLVASMFWKTGHQTDFGLQLNVAFHVVNFGLPLYVLYGKNKAVKGASEYDGGNSRMRSILRVAYVQQLGWGLGWFLAENDTYAMVGGEVESGASEVMAKVLGACLILLAMMTIAISQCAEADQKKYIQYGLAGQMGFVTLFLAGGMGDLMLKNTTLQMTQFQFALMILNIMLMIWGAYPATGKTWFMRWSYVFWAVGCAGFRANSKLLLGMLQIPQVDSQWGNCISWLMGLLCMWCIVAAQSDDGAQRKALQYHLVSQTYGLYLVLIGDLNVGDLFGAQVAFLAISFYLCYPQYFSFLDGVVDAITSVGGKAVSKMKRGSVSPKGRKRSQTPKKR